MSIKQQKPYSSEFKESAIKLALEGEKPIAHTAKNLGIKKSTLYTWINKHVGPKALVEKSNNNEHVYDENKRLRKVDCQHFSGQIVTHIFDQFHSQLVINNH
jgi:transposase